MSWINKRCRWQAKIFEFRNKRNLSRIQVKCEHILKGVLLSDRLCISGRTHIVTYHRISRKKCITQWWITLSIYITYLKHDFTTTYVEEGSFNLDRNCQILMTFFDFIFNTICVPYIFWKFITIMIRLHHYVIHLHLMIRH